MIRAKLTSTVHFKQVQRQTEKATIQALNNVAFDIQQSTRQKLPTWLTLKRDLLTRSVAYDKATSTKPYAQVGFAERAHPKKC